MYWSESKRGGILEAVFGVRDEAGVFLSCGVNDCACISGYDPPDSLTLRAKASDKSALGNILLDQGVCHYIPIRADVHDWLFGKFDGTAGTGVST
jgi:hypothetical protein